MIDCVIDSSVLILALGGKEPCVEGLRERLTGMGKHAPYLIDAEVGNVLRRHERAGLLEPAEADAARRAASVLIDHRYPHTGAIGDLAWKLRHNLTFYGAQYVALAAHLGLGLLTVDTRIAGAPDLPCPIETV